MSNKLIRNLQKQRYLVPLLISNVLLPVITNIGTGWLQEYYSNTPAMLLQVLLYIVGFGVTVFIFYLFLGREKPKDLTTPDQHPLRMNGLIVIVGTGRKDTSPEELSHNVAIKYHLEANPNPLVCWLIASDGLHGTIAPANELVAQYKSQCRAIRVMPLKDAFSIQESYELVRKIHKQAEDEFGLLPSQVIADFTGGTKPMSAGMILACADNYPMQYVYGGNAIIKEIPVLIDFKS